MYLTVYDPNTWKCCKAKSAQSGSKRNTPITLS